MTKKECIERIRAIERKCRGPLTEDALQMAAELQQQIATASDQEAEPLKRKLLRLRAESRYRRGCGYDFNKTIVENPWDGKTRQVKCPQCGVVTTYTAPVF